MDIKRTKGQVIKKALELFIMASQREKGSLTYEFRRAFNAFLIIMFYMLVESLFYFQLSVCIILLFKITYYLVMTANKHETHRAYKCIICLLNQLLLK